MCLVPFSVLSLPGLPRGLSAWKLGLGLSIWSLPCRPHGLFFSFMEFSFYHLNKRFILGGEVSHPLDGLGQLSLSPGPSSCCWPSPECWGGGGGLGGKGPDGGMAEGSRSLTQGPQHVWPSSWARYTGSVKSQGCPSRRFLAHVLWSVQSGSMVGPPLTRKRFSCQLGVSTEGYDVLLPWNGLTGGHGQRTAHSKGWS